MTEKKDGQVAQHGRIGKPPGEYISTLSPAISHEFRCNVEFNILYLYFNIRNLKCAYNMLTLCVPAIADTAMVAFFK